MAQILTTEVTLSDQLDPLSDQLDPLSDQFTNLNAQLTDEIREELKLIGKRIKNKDILNDVICKICSLKPYSLKELSIILRRNEKYLLEHFIIPLREGGRLQYKFPDMPNHPDQSYKTA